MSKILFINMPFLKTSWGSLALSQLQSLCQEAGLEAKVEYLNVPFAQAIGQHRYNAIADVDEAEICFTSALYPDIAPETTWQQYINLIRGSDQIEDDKIRELKNDFMEIAVKQVPQFLETAMADIVWQDVDVVGFTTGFNQTVASLALAHLIRKRFPNMFILFGGPACESEMGEALFEYFDMLDVVVSGEADDLIVPLIQALRNNEPVNTDKRIYARKSSRVKIADEQIDTKSLIKDSAKQLSMIKKDWMNNLPIPNYDDYFDAVKNIQHEQPVMIPFESSRGCWWGQKHQCSFCGLNGTNISFRTKSVEKIMDEIRTQYQRYGVTKFCASDCIIDMKNFNRILSGLKELNESYGITTFYETRSNLSKKHLSQLIQSGVTDIQPGIESFSDHVLELMGKGVSALTQVRFIRDCAGVGMKTYYGILWGNPNEKEEDYHDMDRLIPFIKHLPPPNYITSTVLHRFSPIFANPEKFGVEKVKPFSIYRLMFGDQPYDYDRLAYLFSFDHKINRDKEMLSAWQKFITSAKMWQEQYLPNSLICSEIDNILYISDQRDSKNKVYKLLGMEKMVFELCEKGCSLSKLMQMLPDYDAAHLLKYLDKLVENKLMFVWEKALNKAYLSLPVDVSQQQFLQTLKKENNLVETLS